MAQYIDKDALVAEIEKRKKEAESNCGGYKSYDEHRCDSCIVGFYEEFLEILNTLEVKELQEEAESIWHDANQQPAMYRKYLVRYSDGRVSGSWERHDDGFIPWKDVVKEHSFTHWCYVEDLLKL